MPLRCDAIAMTSHDVTGHGGVRAARALGLCLLVCFVLGQETPVSGNSLGSDVTKTYSSTQSQGDASSGPRTRHQGKVWRVFFTRLGDCACAQVVGPHPQRNLALYCRLE